MALAGFEWCSGINSRREKRTGKTMWRWKSKARFEKDLESVKVIGSAMCIFAISLWFNTWFKILEINDLRIIYLPVGITNFHQYLHSGYVTVRRLPSYPDTAFWSRIIHRRGRLVIFRYAKNIDRPERLASSGIPGSCYKSILPNHLSLIQETPS